MDAYISEWVVTWLRLIGKAVWLEKEATRLGRHDDAAQLRRNIEDDIVRLRGVIRAGLEEYSRGPKR
jgi:hypothetical protein